MTFLDRLAITPEEMIEARKRHEARALQDFELRSQVCVCGHSTMCHSTMINPQIPDSDLPLAQMLLRRSGVAGCRPGKQACPCEVHRPVFTTSDVRKFMSKTSGPGEQHALFKGMLTAEKSQVAITWLPGVGCFSCGREDVQFSPVALDPWGFESTLPTKDNRLLCYDCRYSIWSGATARLNATQEVDNNE